MTGLDHLNSFPILPPTMLYEYPLRPNHKLFIACLFKRFNANTFTMYASYDHRTSTYYVHSRMKVQVSKIIPSKNIRAKALKRPIKRAAISESFQANARTATFENTFSSARPNCVLRCSRIEKKSYRVNCEYHRT